MHGNKNTMKLISKIAGVTFIAALATFSINAVAEVDTPKYTKENPFSVNYSTILNSLEATASNLSTSLSIAKNDDERLQGLIASIQKIDETILPPGTPTDFEVVSVFGAKTTDVKKIFEDILYLKATKNDIVKLLQEMEGKKLRVAEKKLILATKYCDERGPDFIKNIQYFDEALEKCRIYTKNMATNIEKEIPNQVALERMSSINSFYLNSHFRSVLVIENNVMNAFFSEEVKNFTSDAEHYLDKLTFLRKNVKYFEAPHAKSSQKAFAKLEKALIDDINFVQQIIENSFMLWESRKDPSSLTGQIYLGKFDLPYGIFKPRTYSDDYVGYTAAQLTALDKCATWYQKGWEKIKQENPDYYNARDAKLNLH